MKLGTTMGYNNTTFAASVATLYAPGYDNESDIYDRDDNDNLPPILTMTDDCLLYSFIVYTVAIGTLCIAGLVGNLISFAVFWTDKIKTSTSFLFQGLSLIDTTMLLLVFPVYCIDAMVSYTGWFETYSHYIDPWVKVYIFPLALMNQTATIWTTVLVGVNRYIAVCKPYQAPRLCTVAQARKQLTTVLVCAVLYNLPKFFEARVVQMIHVTPTRNYTRFEPEYTALGMESYYLIIYGNICYLIFMLILPVLILSVLNIRLVNALNALKRKRAEMQTQRQQQDNNVTLVLIIVVLVFIIGQTPALVNQILWNVLSNHHRECHGFQFYFQRISNALVISNSAVNFLIYFLFNKRFRQVLVTMVCRTDYKSIRPTTTNHNGEGGTSETLL